MSQTKNREIISWKAILVRLRCIETTWNGTRLSKVDHDTFTEAILMNAMVLYDLSNRYDGFGSYRDIVNWSLNTTSIDIVLLASALSETICRLRLVKADSDYCSYADFKRQLSPQFPFIGKLLGPICGAVELYLSHPTAALLYPVYQSLSFMTHLTLVDLDMSQQLEDEYSENESRVAALHFPPLLIQQMNSIMVEWFRDFRIDSQEFVPRHGSGAIAEFPGQTILYDKYRLLQPDAIIQYVFRKHADLDVREFVPLAYDGVTSRQASVVFVPKSMKTKRVISKEPATLMYFQQGVDRCIRKYIRQHKYLSRCMDLSNQAVQRDKALEASRTLKYATVDLSAASDSVSYELVKRVFRGTPLYPYLVALRSRTVSLPSSKVLRMTKFAPMGSALCFPIESLIFACITECAVRYRTYEDPSLEKDFRVYGDDIIVPDHCLYDLEIFLSQCGFRLNPSKTYGGLARFRESCGCDAYDGTDITCMKIGRRYTSRQVNQMSPGIFAGLIAMANTAVVFNFPSLRHFLVDKLVNGTRWTPQFSGDPSVGLYSSEPDNYRLNHRFNADYQIREVYATRVLTIQSQLCRIEISGNRSKYRELPAGEFSEDIRYFEWLRGTYNRTGDPFDPDFRYSPNIGSAITLLRKSWLYER